MDLIYCYPWRIDPPAFVGKKIFEYLNIKKDKLPFEEIKVVTAPDFRSEVHRKFEDVELLNHKDLNNALSDSIVHVPVSPLVFPNIKFLLHVLAILKRRDIILNYHGDFYYGLRYVLNYGLFPALKLLPTYSSNKYLLKSATKLVVNSYFMSNLVRSKYDLENDVVIPNGIDSSWFDKSEKDLDLQGDPTILYHGRLSPEKGVDILIKGLSKVYQINPKMKLYIIGSGPQEEELKRLARDLGVSTRVEFLGIIHDLKSYLNAADVAIYPSVYEPFSLAVLEALSSLNGPVYYSNLAGIHDFVLRDGFNLKSFNPTVENVSSILMDVANGKYDKKIKHEQKAFAQRYEWNKVIDRYIKLYSSMIENY